MSGMVLSCSRYWQYAVISGCVLACDVICTLPQFVHAMAAQLSAHKHFSLVAAARLECIA